MNYLDKTDFSEDSLELPKETPLEFPERTSSIAKISTLKKGVEKVGRDEREGQKRQISKGEEIKQLFESFIAVRTQFPQSVGNTNISSNLSKKTVEKRTKKEMEEESTSSKQIASFIFTIFMALFIATISIFIVNRTP